MWADFEAVATNLRKKYLKFFHAFDYQSLSTVQMERVAKVLSDLIDENRRK